MARKKASNTTKTPNVADYRFDEATRTNIPPARIADEGTVPVIQKPHYRYNPHLPPELRYDPTGEPDALPDLLAESIRRPLTPEEARILTAALRQQQPWLEWAGKQEEQDRDGFSVEPVALHLHERIAAQAILKAAERTDIERDLFADPQQPYAQAIQFYKHEMDWANRLILGDSLEVMASLSRREDLAGKVQMIYLDPPYGIKFASNFQPEIGRRDVKDKDEDLTREPEQIKAFRDTWHLGIHSYLSYLRDRLIVAKDLLADTGSIFVQISDENIHRVRQLMDEVFGAERFVAQIAFRTSVPLGATYIPSVVDYILWYSRNDNPKFNRLFEDRVIDADSRYGFVQLPSGERRRLTSEEREDPTLLPEGSRVFVGENLNSAGRTPSCIFDVTFEGRVMSPTQNKSWKTNPDGMERAKQAERLNAPAENLNYVLFLDDYPVREFSNIWLDSQGASGKIYVVQTATKIIERCLLMTTDPGDLVLDPTCGSGTTAFVAEQWGRRWITIDTSRVAIALARQRLLTAKFDAYQVKDDPHNDGHADPSSGFIYKTVPHITLGSIARNVALDPVFAKHQPRLDAALAECNAALAEVSKATRAKLEMKLMTKQKAEGKKSITDADRRRWQLPTSRFEHWTVPFDTDEAWPARLSEAVNTYRAAWRAKMDEVNAVIDAGAEQEELVDQPQVIKGVVRVSGPFTVEAVQPPEMSLGEVMAPAAEQFAGAPAALDGTFGEGGTSWAVRPVEVTPDPTRDPQSVAAYLDKMVKLLRETGVRFPNNKTQRFDSLTAIYDSRTGGGFHAEGTWRVGNNGDAKEQTVGVVFGPQHGPVTSKMIENLIKPARRRYDALIVAGFNFTAEAQAIADDPDLRDFPIHIANVSPDASPGMDGLLKNRHTDQLFTVFGQPRVELRGPDADGQYTVEMEGVDVFDPVTNMVKPTGASKVAAWFLDSDYDGRTFCITQAFFPDRSAWDKLARALKETMDESAFETFSGTTSLPFAKGEHGRCAVKVIDPRGNEVMAVRELS